MDKQDLSTNALPTTLDDEARFSLWREAFCIRIGETDFIREAPDGPFEGHWDFLGVKEARLARFVGSAHAMARSAQQVAAAPDEYYYLGFNLAPTAMAFAQAGRHSVIAAGQASLFNGVDAFRCDGARNWISVGIPKPTLDRMVRNLDDLTALPIDGTSPSMRYLQNYAGMLLQPGGFIRDATLDPHIATALHDLVALTLGATGDAAALARGRGLRAARCADVLDEIRKGFADPAFSVQRVANKTGMSPSYVQKLLNETGVSFTERVIEFRLGKAQAMLADRRNDHLKIGDIALACGFNEISYFNRCFRRRFGDAPSAWRGTGTGALQFRERTGSRRAE